MIQNKLSFINIRQSRRLKVQYIVTASRAELCSCDFQSKYFLRGVADLTKTVLYTDLLNKLESYNQV